MAVSLDVSLRCKICKSFYELSDVTEHYKNHEAMELMRLKKETSSVDSLFRRYGTISSKVMRSFRDDPLNPDLMKKMEKIKEAYERMHSKITKDNAILKASLVDQGIANMKESCLHIEDSSDIGLQSVNIPTFNTEKYPTCIAGIGQCQTVNKEWRAESEDRIKITTDIASLDLDEACCYIGMFDGHHGRAAADSCSENMHNIISQTVTDLKQKNALEENGIKENSNSEENSFFGASEDVDISTTAGSLTDSQISKCMSKSYFEMDKYLSHGVNERSSLRWSGCSALTCIVKDCATSQASKDTTDTKMKGDFKESSNKNQSSKIGRLYVSNAGNVQAYLYRKKKSFKLSELHTCKNEKERIRIQSSNGVVNSSKNCPMIDGVLTTTRGLGNHGNVELKNWVVPMPFTSVAQLSNDSQFVVIGTSTLWDTFSPDDVFRILFHTIPSDCNSCLSRPEPVVHVLHGYSSDLDGQSENAQQRAGLASTLPSIVETEEEEEIEVIFVQAQESESDDEGDSNDIRDESALSKKNEDGSTSAAHLSTKGLEGVIATKDSSSQSKSPSVLRDIALKEKYASVARIMSEELIRACVSAGAVDNISVVVLLLKGFFNEK